MAKFHLTPTGQARECKAWTPEACKYSREAGEEVAHYETKEEAQSAYEKQAEQEHGSTNSLTKKSKKSKAGEFEGRTLDQYKTLANSYYETYRYEKGFSGWFADEKAFKHESLNNKNLKEEILEYGRTHKDNGDSIYQGVDHKADEVVYDKTLYKKVDGYNVMGEPYSIRVQVGKELTPAEAQKVSQLFGYEYAKTGGERGNHYEQDSPNSIVVYADTTKGRAYRRLDEFMTNLSDTLESGTPVRKTDKAGPGTAGTRLVDGFDDLGYVEFYADNTFNVNS